MKNWQEYTLVVVAGIVVALIATVMIFWRNNHDAIVIPTPPPAPSTPPPVVSLPDKVSAPIIITSPDNETVFDTKQITISGEASPSALIVLFINQKHLVITADEQGNFAQTVNLDSGSNLIQATVVDDHGQSFSAERLVVYTNKSLEEILLTEEEVKQVAREQSDGSQENSDK
ncbi:hypothetical protein IJJ08_04230 [bacterium]|nr:hypothetical protein [bacterium]